ncbi:hypothetical protein GIY11_01510 [Aerococcaceae bacterium DSM 109653]|uniref:Uncharacterized protein n=1 Tax=Fundicoccus ignavus TaxID=2664442 RepID=A0A844BFH3_9LACT|nr:hypothetical protein [Fundicoccus ignavus]MRI80710.1 hypothetical protein [Fundicoccus ignavus]
MSQLTRRIRQLEERAGYKESDVYFIDCENLTEKEIENEVKRIRRKAENATIFIDDISIRGEAVEH